MSGDTPGIRMFRLVVVGNGFDLSLGLKTKYEDFIKKYIFDTLKNKAGNLPSVLGCTIDISSSLINKVSLKDKRSTTYNSFLDRLNKEYIENEEPSKLLDFISEINKVLKISYSELLNKIIEKEFNWSDIETTYFNLLFDTEKEKSKTIEEIKLINESFDELIDELNKYLKTIDCESLDFSNYEELFNRFSQSKITIESKISSEYERYVKELGGRRPNEFTLNYTKTIYLNFNYTNSLSKFLSSWQHEIDKELINIHGELNNKEGLKESVIFGYGDEMTFKYKQLEDLGDIESLRFIKSSRYPLNRGYNHLNNIINYDLDNFDVFIVGHSLGLSDRVLLKELFEHKKCVSIRLFHRKGDESYFKLSRSLTYHFDDKVLMRKRLVPFDENDSIPSFK